MAPKLDYRHVNNDLSMQTIIKEPLLAHSINAYFLAEPNMKTRKLHLSALRPTLPPYNNTQQLYFRKTPLKLYICDWIK